MDFRIRWTSPAADDIENLAKTIEREGDYIDSRQVVLQIFEAIEVLATHPHLGQRLQDYPQLRHRIVSSFKVIYMVAEKENLAEHLD